MRNCFCLLAILSVLFPLGSCQHKELCYNHPHTSALNVVIDWSKVGMEASPTMEMLLFPQEGGPAFHCQFTDSRGGKVTVPAGNYKAVCFNTGKGANRFSGLDSQFEAFRITTRVVSDQEMSLQLQSPIHPDESKTDNGSDETAILEPDILYSSAIKDCFTVKSDEEQTVIFYPEQRTPHYTVIFTNVRNLKYTRDCMAILSNLSCAYLTGVDRPDDSGHFQMFPVLKDDATTLKGELTIFGHCHPYAVSHYVSLYFVLMDGRVMKYIFDVTDKFNDPELAGVMSATIVIDLDIELPRPIVNGSGFQPSVDGWSDEDIDVSM